MQLKNYILTFVFFLVVVIIKGQFIWQTTLGTNGTDSPRDFIKTNDGNYLTLGYSLSTSPTKGLHIAKLDTAGVVLWEKWYWKINGNSTFTINNICETLDSGFVMGTRKYNGSSFDGFLIKLDVNGDTLFSLADSVNLGSNVYRVWLAPDGNLLAHIDYQGENALIKMDNSFNVLARVDSVNKPINGVEVINDSIYVLLNDSINNMLIIDNNLNQIDTVTLPILFPLFLRTSFNTDKIIFFGRDYLQNSFHKIIYTDLLGNIIQLCDSVPNIFNDFIDDFKPIDNHENLLFVSRNYQQQWGKDIQLFFTNKCGQVIKDTILYRWSFNTSLDEQAKKLVVDNEGNYLVMGYAQEGPLGDNDIFVFKYGKIEIPKTEEEDEEIIESEYSTMLVYPNPFNNSFTIKDISSISQITIFDVSGKVIEQHVTSNNSFIFKTTNWAKGLYIIHFKSSTITAYFKVVKK